MTPQLVWAGKAERLSFEVEAPSIHVHERLSTEAIRRAVRKEPPQLALFGDNDMNRATAIEFYQHEQDWVNRVILGDSLVVMTSLLEKERLAGRVQMIYIEPRIGIRLTIAPPTPFMGSGTTRWLLVGPNPLTGTSARMKLSNGVGR